MGISTHFSRFTIIQHCLRSDVMTYDVSIIIVDYHTSDLIIDCLQSVAAFTHHVATEVIIVDVSITNAGRLTFWERLHMHCIK